ncbi:MAG: 4Fe-4S binding protein [Rhodospirillaceae bacterium]|nr:4Fe-4S binding protein [Rhodospirillales bacterium]
MMPRQLPPGEASRLSARVAGPVEAFFVRNIRWLPWVHAVMFVVFVSLILVPALLSDPAENAGPLDHLAVFANLALWGLWFPLLLLSVLATGRSWCGLLCPMGAASEYASKHGFRLSPPRWLTWPGTPVLSFIVVTILGQTTGVRTHPEAAAEIFGGTMAAAIILGWLFAPGKRPWCRHACPIGLLLGVFNRLSIVDFAPKRPEPGGDRWNDKGACPTMIDLRHKTETRHCIECFRCVSPPAPGGLFLRLRRPGEEIEQIAKRNPNLSEVLFLFLGGGVALGGFLWGVLPFFVELRDALGLWAIEHDVAWLLESGPSWLMSVHPDRREVFLWLDFVMITGFMAATMLAFTLGLSLLTMIASWLAGLAGANGTLRSRFLELGYQFTPIAMVSLLIGLGGGLFTAMKSVGLPAEAVSMIKIALFVGGITWSLWLAWRILATQNVTGIRSLPALVPGLAGTVAVALAWWPALF